MKCANYLWDELRLICFCCRNSRGITRTHSNNLPLALSSVFDGGQHRMFHHLYSYRNTVGCVMLLLSQTMRLEVALFHCSCTKGALSHKPLTCQISLQGPLWAARELNPLPFSLERPTDTPALFPWRQNWMLLGEERAHGKGWAPGISPGLTLAHRGAGIWGWKCRNALSCLQNCPGICPWQNESCHPRCDGVLHLLVVWHHRPLLASHNQISVTAFPYLRAIDNYQY